MAVAAIFWSSLRAILLLLTVSHTSVSRNPLRLKNSARCIGIVSFSMFPLIPGLYHLAGSEGREGKRWRGRTVVEWTHG